MTVNAPVLTPGNDRRRPPGRRPAPTRPLPQAPDPSCLAGLLVRACDEVAAGRRPVGQVSPLLAPALTRRLVLHLRRTRGTPPPPPLRIRRALAADPTPSGAVEVTVLVERDGRVSAVAVRLERHRGTWRATELTAPESGYRPLATASEPSPVRRDAFDEAETEEALLSPARGSA